MNFVIERIGRENYDEEAIIDNFSYEFFEDDIVNLKNKNSNCLQQNLLISNEIKNKIEIVNENTGLNQNKDCNNNKDSNKNKDNNNNNKNSNNKESNDNKDDNNEMIIDFDEEHLERKDSNKNNYSLDQEDIIEILNLNKDNNNNIINNGDNIEKNLFDKLNAKILLKDLQEKKKQFKHAYAEYSSKLKETMNNDYVKNIMENSVKKKSKNKIKNDFLIHQQTNTINDINIFCLNNKDNNNNFINFNKPEKKIFTDNNDNKSKINIINFEYMKNPDNNQDFKEFLSEYNISLQKRTYMDVKKNPNLNYESYIDILNDLNYIDISISPEIYFLNNSIYKHLWNFLITINNNNIINTNETTILESNSLLILLLILNGFFNSIKKLIEIKSELNWLKIENYEILIINDKYIEKNFSILKEIREKNKKHLIEDKIELHKFSDNFNNILDQKIKSIEISNFQDDIISDYLKSFGFNNNSNEINTNNIQKKAKLKKKNNSTTKLYKTRKYINEDDTKQKQLYAFKPKIKNISFINERQSLKQRNHSRKINKVNKYSANSTINNINLRKTENKSGSKSKTKLKINYIDFVDLSTNDINNKNNKSFVNNNINRRNENSNSKLKSRKYSNKIKQNRTDLMKLINNNKYKEGTINEKYEEIKRKRESNSKSKTAKIRINYKNIINIDDNINHNNNEGNPKHKYQFKKKVNT